jgi:hypothetical protein
LRNWSWKVWKTLPGVSSGLAVVGVGGRGEKASLDWLRWGALINADECPNGLRGAEGSSGERIGISAGDRADRVNAASPVFVVSRPCTTPVGK